MHPATEHREEQYLPTEEAASLTLKIVNSQTTPLMELEPSTAKPIAQKQIQKALPNSISN